MTNWRFEHGHALLIGVGRSTYEPWTLESTARDAEQVKLTLTDPSRCGYPSSNIRLLVDEQASRQNTLAALSDLRSRISRESTVIVYFSGHGWLSNDGRYSLLLADTDPHDFAATCLWETDFSELLRSLEPARLLVVLDTCHAGGMAEPKAAQVVMDGFRPKAPPEDWTTMLSRGRGRVVLSSCRGEEKSWLMPDGGFSLFTRHFVDALQGAGSPTARTFVTVLDVAKYVAWNVTRAAAGIGKVQNPVLDAAEMEDFPLAAMSAEAEEGPATMAAPEPEPTERTSTPGASQHVGEIVKSRYIRNVTFGPKTNYVDMRRK